MFENIINFILKKKPISQFVFKYNTKILKTIDIYTYLGIILDKHITFLFISTVVTHLIASHFLLLLVNIMFMEIVLMICNPTYMIHVLFQQYSMVLKYLDIIINPNNLETKYKQEHTSAPSHDGRYGVD